jgi:hypothetical protein
LERPKWAECTDDAQKREIEAHLLALWAEHINAAAEDDYEIENIPPGVEITTLICFRPGYYPTFPPDFVQCGRIIQAHGYELQHHLHEEKY